MHAEVVGSGSRAARAVVAVAAGVSAMITAGAQPVAAAWATATVSGGDPTIGYANERTNWDRAEARLGPSSVTASDFGGVFATTLPATTTATPNQIYAQPIVADGTLVVATEDDQVDGLDPDTGGLRWTKSLGTPWTPVSCGDLVPHVGVTSTPVYDPLTDSVYVAAKTSDSGVTHYRLHALDPASGQERTGWPVTIAGASSNGGQVFNAQTANQRAGLLLLDGAVYLAFASHCDQGPYVGYVAGVNLATRALSLWSTEAQLANAEGGIWQSGGGLVSDGSGRIFAATGNGISPAPGPGDQPPGTLAESVVRLQVGGGGIMSATDYFSPANNAKLDQNDSDLGSGGPIALPDSFGTPSHPHLLAQSGKDGVVRLLDRDHLGGTAQGPGGTDADLSELQLQGLWGRMAAYSSASGNYLFLLPSTSPLQALRVSPNAAGVPTLSLSGTSADTYSYTSGSPIVTSDGTDDSSAVVWVVTCDRQTGANAFLRAYALPGSAPGAWIPLASFPVGTVAKFVQPATYNGRVYVGTRDGRVLAFGRPLAAALNAPSTDFGQQPVGGPATVQNVTITAEQPVTVDGLSTTAPFAVDAAPRLPATLATGQSISVPVSFTPTEAGAASGTLRVLASTGSLDDEYDFGLHGIGTADGLAAVPQALAFGDVSTGTAARLGVIVQNTGATDETIQTLTAPASGGPFSLLDSTADVAGRILLPQQSLTLTVQFDPVQAGTAAGALTLTADKGSPLTIPLSGNGIVGAPAMSFDTTSLDFGDVQPGSARTLSFVLTNSGTAPLTITKAAAPAAPFSVAAPIGEGQSVPPGDSLTVAVTYRPTSAEPASDAYSITGNTGDGPHMVTLEGNRLPWTGAVNWPLGCLEDYSGVLANGNPAVSSPCSSVTRQQFSFESVSHALHFGSPASTWCLAVQGAGAASGTSVVLATCDGGVAQQWVWRANNSLYNPHSAKCLDVPHQSTAANTKLWIYSCNGTDAQYWDLSRLQAARGAVSAGVGAAFQYCLDDSGGRTTNGNPIQIWTCNLTPAQIVTHVGSTLRVLGKCIDVASSGTASGTHVQLYRCNGSAAQQWQVGTNASLVNPHSGKCMDDPRRSTTPGTQLQIYTCNGTVAQRWSLPG